MCHSRSRFHSWPALIIVICFVFLTSGCKKEKVYPDPDIEFIQEAGYIFSDTTMTLNESFKIGLKMGSNSDVQITHFNKTVDRDGEISSIDTAMAVMDCEIEFTIDKSLAENETWSFYCRDRDSRKSEVVSVTVHLDTSSVFGEIKYITSIVLGAQGNSEHGKLYSLSDQKVMSLTEGYVNQGIVNLAYYYDTFEDDKNTIASPGANIDVSIYSDDNAPVNWTVKNTTRFIQAGDVNQMEFEACKNDSLIIANSFDFSSGKRKAKKLGGGQVYSFVTDDGQKGMFLVKELVGDIEGHVEISLKMMSE